MRKLSRNYINATYGNIGQFNILSDARIKSIQLARPGHPNYFEENIGKGRYL